MLTGSELMRAMTMARVLVDLLPGDLRTLLEAPADQVDARVSEDLALLRRMAGERGMTLEELVPRLARMIWKGPAAMHATFESEGRHLQP